MVAPLVLGLDLHGTLLQPGEILPPELVPDLAASATRLKSRLDLMICTGNDLAFVLRKVPPELREHFTACVLETGASVSSDGTNEQVITTDTERAAIASLEARLRAERFPELDYFAHRLTTISMFCRYPREFYARVAAFVAHTPEADAVLVTYSSVAVDIIPAGYHKFRGLSALAHGRKTIGVADSMNDLPLLALADYAFAPANLAPELIPILSEKGRPVVRLKDQNSLTPGTVVVASQNETLGVLEIMRFLGRVVE
jgi:hydroxymethylpyrimidine pyrophosphatase-like HAD family hydrolase